MNIILLTNILGWVNMLLFSLIALPQIIKTLKLKKVEGVSISVYWIMLIANIDAGIYAILINQLPLLVKYIFGFISAIIYLIIYYKYKKD